MKTQQLPKIGTGAFRGLMQGLLSFTVKKIKFVDDKSHLFAAGLYLVAGPGGSGKSVVGRALVNEAISSGWEDAGVLAVFEPNSPSYGQGEFVNDAKFINETPQSAAGSADIFSGDLGRLLSTWQASRSDSSAQAALTIDSIARPMRSYLTEARKEQPAATGGFQSADLAFTQRVNDTAVHLNLTIFGVVSNELVPFAHILDGVCQGIITATSFSRFRVQDRPSGRQQIPYTLTAESCRQAFLALGYETKDFEAVYERDAIAGSGMAVGPVVPHSIIRGSAQSVLVTE
jgi:hypothetical protein